jgi:hypothetical protein
MAHVFRYSGRSFSQCQNLNTANITSVVMKMSLHNPKRYRSLTAAQPLQYKSIRPNTRSITGSHSLLLHHLQTFKIIIIKSFHSLWSTGLPWRASRHCGLQLSPWPRSMILCFLSHPLLSFATFSSAYLSFYIPEDSNLMQFSLLPLFLYVMCVQPNSIFFFLSYFLLTSDGWFTIVLRS